MTALESVQGAPWVKSGNPQNDDLPLSLGIIGWQLIRMLMRYELPPSFRHLITNAE
jgi:hypothetical protein